MVIKYKKVSTALFSTIKIGNCFKVDNELYIKINSYLSKDNAFNVNLNIVETINSDAEVIPINMTLVEE